MSIILNLSAINNISGNLIPIHYSVSLWRKSCSKKREAIECMILQAFTNYIISHSCSNRYAYERELNLGYRIDEI